MRWLIVLFLSAAVLRAADARIIKVLPHYLDQKGRHTLSPSLYERDAYQAYLRQHPDERAGLRFDVEWKAKKSTEPLKMKVEMRSVKGDQLMRNAVEMPLPKPGFFGRWNSITLEGEQYRAFGDIVAWRVSIWDGTNLLAEQKSFLW